jgi:polysaccharide export outer membrane protein
MTFSLPLEASTLEALMQTLVHFLWQGLLLAVGAACLLQVASLRTAQARYAFYCGLFALLAASPVVTFSILSAESASSAAAVVENDANVLSPLAAEVASGARVDRRQRTSFHGEGQAATVAAWMDRHQSLIVGSWLAGVMLFGARLVFAAIGLRSLGRKCLPPPRHVTLAVERLARQMAFRAAPRFFIVERLSQAAAVGIFKPMVVLPAAWLCELPPNVLEAVLAHELAHLRRWDLPINFLQRLVEMALFFHPAVWWCSRRIRIERELCCDGVALAAVGSRADYARALTYLADQRLSPSRMMLAAGIGGTKMVLLERIRNVLGLSGTARGRFYGPSCAAAGATLASLAWLVAVVGFSTDDNVNAQSPAAAPRVPAPLGGHASRHATRQPPKNGRGQVAPSERAKWRLPTYTIEPPDILLIEAMHVVPKADYRIQSSDVLSIAHTAAEQPYGVRHPLANYAGEITRSYTVDGEGKIDLGLSLGKLKVGGLTQDEANRAIRENLEARVDDPTIWVRLSQCAGLPPIGGEHLVGPDGIVNLGPYGQVGVAGLTLEAAKTAIEEKLAAVLEQPRVTVQVFAYNSKVYYVIVEGGDSGDTVARLPITGAETVLDALSQVNGVEKMSTKRIWIARPAPGIGGVDTILPVNWIGITQGADASSNYQVLPGDRIFISNRRAGIYNELRYFFFSFFRAASTGSLARGSFRTLPVSAAL